MRNRIRIVRISLIYDDLLYSKLLLLTPIAHTVAFVVQLSCDMVTGRNGDDI